MDQIWCLSPGRFPRQGSLCKLLAAGFGEMGIGHGGGKTELRLGKLVEARASFQQENDMIRSGCLQREGGLEGE